MQNTIIYEIIITHKLKNEMEKAHAQKEKEEQVPY